MGKWSSILKYGKTLMVNPVTKTAGSAITHPQRTLVGAGTAVKSATIGAGVGYIGWEAIVNDKPVARTVADLAIGSDNVDAVVDTTKSVANGVGEVVHGASEAVGAVAGTASQTGSALNGISDFLKNVTSGGGMNMFGNFFGNLAKGNIGGMSIVGLLAAGLLIFGRFGWLGKIGGALLAMMLIGNGSKLAQAAPQLAPEGSTVKR